MTRSPPYSLQCGTSALPRVTVLTSTDFRKAG